MNPTHVVPSSPSASLATTNRLLDEGLLSIREAARREGISISPKTALRWALSGVGGVRLESVRVAGRRMTSRAAVRRFVAAQQCAKVPAEQAIDRTAAAVALAAHGLGREATGA